jgi:AraC family transcriptional regulator
MLHGNVESTGKWSAADRKSRGDWVVAENSLFDRMDDYTIEQFTAFPGGRLEVRRFAWSQPMHNVWHTSSRCYLLCLSLSKEEPPSTWTHLDTGLQVSKSVRTGLTFVPPGQHMSASFAAGSSRSVGCMLDAQIVEAYLADTPKWNWDEGLLTSCAHVEGTEIEWLLRRMYREVQVSDFATPDLLETLAKQIADEIIRKFKLRSSDGKGPRGGLARWRMGAIRERLYSEAPLPLLEELADLCDLNVRQLSRAFRVETGQTLGKYVDSAMVARAEALLHKRLSVEQVGRTLGYSNAGAFATAFRRATGVRPREIKMAGARAR